MRWKTLTRVVQKLVKDNSYKLWKEYLYLKYSNRAIEICIVNANDNQIVYNTGFMSAVPISKGDVACRLIRKTVGQYILLRYGKPEPGSSCPVVVLFPTPSLLFRLGPINFHKFLKEWPGQSEVEGIPVVKYTILS